MRAGLRLANGPWRAFASLEIMSTSKKSKSEHLLAYSTVVLAIVTTFMAFETWQLAKESRDASYRQIGVQTWLEFEKRFDAPEMVRARKKLALQLRASPAPKYDDIDERVPDFFEDVGIAYKSGYLDTNLANSSFSMFATRYYEAMRPFIDQERRLYGGDPTINDDFEALAKAMLGPGEKIDEKQLDQFLQDEINLGTN
jgi:hypothetical protein